MHTGRLVQEGGTVMAIVNIDAARNIKTTEKMPLSYRVYTDKGVAPDGEVFHRSHIVLKNDETGDIVQFTRLEEYAGVYKWKTFKPIYSDTEKRLGYICQMLNYILVFRGGDYRIGHVFQITKPMMAEFFNYYALSLKKDGEPKGEASVDQCIRACTAFMYGLCKVYGKTMGVWAGELYRQAAVRRKGGDIVEQNIPDFQASGYDVRGGHLLRDMPSDVFCLFIPMAFEYAPDIAFAIICQCTAGLRPGEVLNMRRPDSPEGPGVTFTREGGEVTDIEIDLCRRLPLRSDGITTGGIKRPRKQHVYGPFIPLFMYAYDRHMEAMKDRDYEKEFYPMFLNRNGMAMTYDTYAQKLEALICGHLRPALLASAVPSLRLYGQLLAENHFPAHGFRHFFSCQLALNGESIANIQSWRGDQNPESALWYLRNKSELRRTMSLKNDWLAKMMMEMGSKGTR